jgi:G3E family GTPase
MDNLQVRMYLFTGFLESGKSTFINDTIVNTNFTDGERSVLIVTEEGEVEYKKEELEAKGTHMVVVEDPEEFTLDFWNKIKEDYDPTQILIEFNGMWNFKDMKLPFHWKIEQQITTIDGATFPMYFTNMRSLLAEMVRKSEMIIFNRCDGIEELNVYKRNIKAVNPNADVIFEDANGEIDTIFEEDLHPQK